MTDRCRLELVHRHALLNEPTHGRYFGEIRGERWPKRHHPDGGMVLASLSRNGMAAPEGPIGTAQLRMNCNLPCVSGWT